MNDHDPIREVVKRGFDPVMEQAPEPPEWESLQLEKPVSSSGAGRWWVAGVAAAIVLVVGAGIAFVSGSGSTDSDDAGTDPAAAAEAPGTPFPSIAGVWLLESFEVEGEEVLVESGSDGEAPWIEFHETFVGTRETFVDADSQGTAGTFTGDTGCNKINHGYEVGYEFSAGFLVLEETIVEAAGCATPDSEAVEEAILAMLWNTPDGIEVTAGDDRMTWYGSNLQGISEPLTFRRAGAPPNPHPEDPPPVVIERTVRVFNIDGLEVVIPTETTDAFGQLPYRAEKVELTTTIIDSGSGPELCLGAVDDSLPPQCSGPVANGLDMTGWAEEGAGVRWGVRTVVVTWPPVGGHVQVLDDSRFSPGQPDYPHEVLPSECADIEHFVGVEAVNNYANTLGDRNGDLYVTNEGVLVLQVVGDPQDHRDALASDGREACVIEVERSASEQRAIQESLGPRLADLVGPYSSRTGPGGRVEVTVAVADGETAEAVASLVEDRTSLRIVGTGVLLP